MPEKLELTVCFKLVILIFSPLRKTLKIIQKFACRPNTDYKDCFFVFLHVCQEKR